MKRSRSASDLLSLHLLDGKKSKSKKETTIHDIPEELITIIMWFSHPFTIVMYRPLLGSCVDPVAEHFFRAIRPPQFPLCRMEVMCEWLWSNVKYMDFKVDLDAKIMMGAFASCNREAFIWFRRHGLFIAEEQIEQLFCMGDSLDMLDIYARYTGKTSSEDALKQFPSDRQNVNNIIRIGNTKLLRLLLPTVCSDDSYRGTQKRIDMLKNSLKSGNPDMTKLVLEYTDSWEWASITKNLRVELTWSLNVDHLRNIFEWSERLFMEKHSMILRPGCGEMVFSAFLFGWYEAALGIITRSNHTTWPKGGDLTADYVNFSEYVMESLLPCLFGKRDYLSEDSIHRIPTSVVKFYSENYEKLHMFALVCIPALEYYFERWWIPMMKNSGTPQKEWTFIETGSFFTLSLLVSDWVDSKKHEYPLFHVDLREIERPIQPHVPSLPIPIPQ
jgi:hypothetical protein